MKIATIFSAYVRAINRQREAENYTSFFRASNSRLGDDVVDFELVESWEREAKDKQRKVKTFADWLRRKDMVAVSTQTNGADTLDLQAELRRYKRWAEKVEHGLLPWVVEYQDALKNTGQNGDELATAIRNLLTVAGNFKA